MIRAELSPLTWRSAAVDTAINQAKEHVIPFPPGEAKGAGVLGA